MGEAQLGELHVRDAERIKAQTMKDFEAPYIILVTQF